jgi:hypothetical protein
MTENDERYKEGKIYAIRNITDDTMIYIGSTVRNLDQRFDNHKYDCKRGMRCILYNNIENNDWTLWYIELYENYPCNNKKELNRREGEIIRERGSLNKNIAGRTRKEYREDKVDKNKEVKKKYYEQNSDKIIENVKKYSKENSDKIKENNEKKVCCSICGTFSTKTHIRRHQTTKKCFSKTIEGSREASRRTGYRLRDSRETKNLSKNE